MDNLKPCPFCGYKPKIKHDLNSQNEPFYQMRHDCMCLLSEIRTFCYKTEEEAISAWNRRADRWVPVEERLPEDGTLVLGCDDYGRIDMFQYDGAMYQPMWDECVTHWMPLPSPPETIATGKRIRGAPMRELPILFSTDMVKAILDGRKTMTRRAVKPQPTYITTSGRWTWPIPKSKVHQGCCTDVCTASREWWEYLAPDQMLYNPGDILYVRETWAKVNGIYIYKADEDATPLKWRPSIHMPKEAARIWLEVTDVRVERLQDITEEDAIKEGVRVGIGGIPYFSCQDAFPALWDSTIKNQDLPLYGWDSNPWVWVYDFKRLEGQV